MASNTPSQLPCGHSVFSANTYNFGLGLHCGICGNEYVYANGSFTYVGNSKNFAATNNQCTHPPGSVVPSQANPGQFVCVDCQKYFASDPNVIRRHYITSAEEESVAEIPITCPVCWRPVTIKESYYTQIEREDRADLSCCKKVPVGGSRGIVARVKEARKTQR